MLRLGFGAMAVLAALTVCARMLRRRIAIVAVTGSSMQPTLTTGDRVLVRRATISEVRRGQIIVFEKPGREGLWASEPPRWPADRREWLIKRVAAIPGDQLPEELLSAAIRSFESSVPAGKLVVLGDNADRSHDSRQIGYIPAERLLGIMCRPLA
jgi:signal peptidase I